ncbi:cupin domain-containing protein [Actinoplanes sp. NPDC049596]|uniref:cupin domain-containing protein n=1 Tax=unclassified Actinoplanes TaxID=2626549 RepID=UPI003415EBBC
MKIVKRDEAVTVVKDDGTRVVYHMFGEYEVHFNELPPGSVQEWHSHAVLEETICVTAGELTILWTDEADQQSTDILHPGDTARVGTSFHTLRNDSDSTVIFIALRLVLSGEDHTRTFKTDKCIDE